MINKTFLFIMLVGLTLTGCGYTTSSALPGHLKTVYVDKFENQIDYTSDFGQRNLYFPLLEVDVRDAVIDRFLFDGNLDIEQSGNSDLTLKGVLTGYKRRALRIDDNDDVEEYRVYVTVRLELWDNVYDEPMWTQTNVSGEATYFLSGPNASSEEAAVEEAIEDLARRVVAKVIENW